MRIEFPQRPDKNDRVLVSIRLAIAEGHYRFSVHAEQRRQERLVELSDVLEVLMTGYHEKSRDEYKAEFRSWNYAIRGKTIEGTELRVAVCFEGSLMVIATVIKLDRSE